MMNVVRFTLQKLAGIIRTHRVDATINGAIDKVRRGDLAVIDDIGLLPVPRLPLRLCIVWLIPRRNVRWRIGEVDAGVGYAEFIYVTHINGGLLF